MHGATLEVGLWLVSAAAAGLCAALIALANLSGRSRAEWLVATGVLFAALVTAVVLGCGLVGRLFPAPVAACHMLALATTCGVLVSKPQLRERAARSLERMLSRGDIGSAEAIAVAALGLMYVAIAAHTIKPHIPMLDALAYHLPLAADWVHNGNLSIDELAPGRYQIHVPANASLAFAWLMLGARSPVLIPVWGILWMAFGTSAVYRLARACQCSRLLALAPAIMFLGMHELQRNVRDDYVDSILACELLCGILATVLAVRTRRTFWAIIAGLAMGLVWGGKASGFVLAGLVGASLLVGLGVSCVRRLISRRRLMALAVLFGVCAGALGLYWPVRNFVRAGSFDYPSMGLSYYLPSTIVARASDYFGTSQARHQFLRDLSDYVGPFLARIGLPATGLLAIVLLAAVFARRRKETLQAPVPWGELFVGIFAPAMLILYLVHPFSAVWALGLELRPGGEMRFGLGAAGLCAILCTAVARRALSDRAAAVVMLLIATATASLPEVSEKLLRTMTLLIIGVALAAVYAPAISRLLRGRPAYLIAFFLPLLLVGVSPRVAHKLDKADAKWRDLVDKQGMAPGADARSWAHATAQKLPPGSRIVAVGVQTTFPYFGRHLDNQPLMISVSQPWSSPGYRAPDWRESATPREDVWLANVAAAKATHVMVADPAPDCLQPMLDWVSSRPDVFRAVGPTETESEHLFTVNLSALAGARN